MKKYLGMFFLMYPGIIIANKFIKPFYFLFIYYLYIYLKKNKIDKNLLTLISVLTFCYIFPIIFTYLFNGNIEIYNIKELILNIVFLIYLMGMESSLKNIDELFDIFININLFQLFLGVIFINNKNLLLKINEFFVNNELYIQVLNREAGTRLIGVGTAFFELGLTSSISLLFILYLFIQRKNKFILYLKYCSTLILGILAARTTFIGFILSVIYIFIFFNYNEKKIILKKFFLYNLIMLFCALIFFKKIFLSEKIQKLLGFGFEIFYNYFKTGKLQSSSTNGLKSMYKVVPTELKTWLFGDGILSDGLFFYKNTDVGYFRMIFYIGILGLSLFLLYKIVLLFFINQKYTNKKIVGLTFMLFILELISNLKGIVDLNKYYYFVIIFVISNKIINKNDIKKVLS